MIRVITGDKKMILKKKKIKSFCLNLKENGELQLFQPALPQASTANGYEKPKFSK